MAYQVITDEAIFGKVRDRLPLSVKVIAAIN